MPTPTQTASVRCMHKRDLPCVLAIDRETGGEWPEGFWLRTMRHARSGGIVAEIGDTITGFAVYVLHGPGVRILNMAALDHPSRLALIAWLKRESAVKGRELIWEGSA